MLVDSDSVKIRDYPFNSLLVKPYSLDDLINRFEKPDETLVQSLDEILRIINFTDDVQEYLKNGKVGGIDYKYKAIKK